MAATHPAYTIRLIDRDPWGNVARPAGELVRARRSAVRLLIPNTTAQMLHCVAANDDEGNPEAKNTLRDAYAAAGISAELEVYEGAMPGWCPTDSQVYNEPQAERAWSRVLVLFESALA